MAKHPIPTQVKIHLRFKRFRQSLREGWNAYQLIDGFMPKVHDAIKSGALPTFAVEGLRGGNLRQLNKQGMYGAIDHLTAKVNPRRVLLDAVSNFEDFLGDVLQLVYRDHPAKLRSKDSQESPEQSEKLLEVILSSQSRAEIIERLIEERVRGIFYGRPSAFFSKDLGKLEFGEYFRVNAAPAVADYAEITARRNVLVHNAGRVDRKYLREVKGGALALGAMVPLDRPYLRKSIATLEGLAAAAGGLASERIYDSPAQGKLASAWRAFEKSLPALKPAASAAAAI
jgi:hypothetical protein